MNSLTSHPGSLSSYLLLSKNATFLHFSLLEVGGRSFFICKLASSSLIFSFRSFTFDNSFVGSKIFSAGFWDDLVQCFSYFVFPGSLMLQMLMKGKKACNFIKKETQAKGFSCEFCKIFKNTFFKEHLPATASQQ